MQSSSSSRSSSSTGPPAVSSPPPPDSPEAAEAALSPVAASQMNLHLQQVMILTERATILQEAATLRTELTRAQVALDATRMARRLEGELSREIRENPIRVLQAWLQRPLFPGLQVWLQRRLGWFPDLEEAPTPAGPPGPTLQAEAFPGQDPAPEGPPPLPWALAYAQGIHGVLWDHRLSLEGLFRMGFVPAANMLGLRTTVGFFLNLRFDPGLAPQPNGLGPATQSASECLSDCLRL